MRLLYWYTQFRDYRGKERQYRGLTHFELNLSPSAHFHFDEQMRELTCTPLDPPLPEGFWGDRIYNLNVVTGSNGSGKSTIIRYIMNTLDHIL